ncbi:MAG: hypothetical protein ACRD12_21200 [Acidimicrobiales bacterium]
MRMYATRTIRWRGALVAAAAALAIGLSAQSAYADVSLTVPGESPGVPAYARVEPGGALHTDEWAVVPFYRLPTCVPEDFNLMAFFDVPTAFGCPLTVSGHEVWDNGPGQEPAPNLAVLHGTDVPVWFASAEELEAADGRSASTPSTPSTTTHLGSRSSSADEPPERAPTVPAMGTRSWRAADRLRFPALHGRAPGGHALAAERGGCDANETLSSDGGGPRGRRLGGRVR